ncbi:unnamed protein product [Rotaria socialis]|uniref:F-box domain-containing protein n=1 Tax=Rotaria socialis TaxID=392032 RepID=A0A818JZV9_9BILA|nr:unnamed protein product [Rotaria socialis]
MANQIPSSFLGLPVELIYRILDNLDNLTLVYSIRDVCIRLNMITDTYNRYQTLTILGLSGIEMGALGAQYLGDALRNNKTLTTLQLSSNPIRDEGAQHLADGLQNNKTLTTLYLTFNKIGDKGAHHLADALRINTALTQLYLTKNEIEDLGAEHLAGALRNNTMKKRITAIIVVQIVLQLVYLSPSIATQPIFNDQDSSKRSFHSPYAESIRIDEVVTHLNELQRIATAANGTRAFNTPGFNHTVDYLTNYLSANTNFKITKSIFPIKYFALENNPIFLSSIDGKITNHTYSKNRFQAEFLEVAFSTSISFHHFVPITVIPNFGCSNTDWLVANPAPASRVALVKRGECAFTDKGILATNYNVTGLLLYNDGTSSDRRSPIFESLGQNNVLPALFLSFDLGERLSNAARNPSVNVSVLFNISIVDEKPIPVANICADTPTGDPTQTILIGSHTDSVSTGPGINDNGSGTAANLAFAVALARIFRTFNYAKYKYRIRFCWWGAEEVGVLGSNFHVANAQNSTVVGERIADYLAYLNFDMLGSPNFIFGIYDGRTIRNNNPPSAIPGSNKISALFRDWFIQHYLPWDFSDFDGRSDYSPFLAAGVAAGGLVSGLDGIKSQEQRDRYEKFLGPGLSGLAGVIHDPCYHKACDTIQNINLFCLENMVQAAAYTIETLARLPDLKGWLYPLNETQYLNV